MKKRAILAAVVYPMVNAVLFGMGAWFVLAVFPEAANVLIWLVVVASFVLSVPISWVIGPKMSLALSGERYDRPARRG